MISKVNHTVVATVEAYEHRDTFFDQGWHFVELRLQDGRKVCAALQSDQFRPFEVGSVISGIQTVVPVMNKRGNVASALNNAEPIISLMDVESLPDGASPSMERWVYKPLRSLAREAGFAYGEPEPDAALEDHFCQAWDAEQEAAQRRAKWELKLENYDYLMRNRDRVDPDLVTEMARDIAKLEASEPGFSEMLEEWRSTRVERLLAGHYSEFHDPEAARREAAARDEIDAQQQKIVADTSNTLTRAEQVDTEAMHRAFDHLDFDLT
ncbi:MAG: hypothetical protein AAGF94_20045 [Pseudomonadota bacterium]